MPRGHANLEALLMPVQDMSHFVAPDFQAIVGIVELFAGPGNHFQNSGSSVRYFDLCEEPAAAQGRIDLATD
ncbi:MAG: hypothetical protein ACK5L2_09860 [Planctomyces sp.]|jgi:hypothetical protein